MEPVPDAREAHIRRVPLLERLVLGQEARADVVRRERRPCCWTSRPRRRDRAGVRGPESGAPIDQDAFERLAAQHRLVETLGIGELVCEHAARRFRAAGTCVTAGHAVPTVRATPIACVIVRKPPPDTAMPNGARFPAAATAAAAARVLRRRDGDERYREDEDDDHGRETQSLCPSRPGRRSWRRLLGKPFSCTSTSS